MIRVRSVADARASSPLGRASPLTKLGIGFVWLLGLAFSPTHLPPVVIAVVTLAAGITLGGIRPGDLVRALLPLWSVALVVVATNVVLGAANTDPLATELARIGPLRVTQEAIAAATALGLRVVAIASVGAVFALTTEPTRLADALVQQAGVSHRFAFGALAAYQSIPRFADDLATLRQARRIRGLPGSWHPRLLLSLLVLAIRHGDRVALAMDARGFGTGPRTHYRPIGWTWGDGVLAIGGLATLVVAAVIAR